MRIYISCDMEGIAGVCSWEQVDARNPTREYETFRAYMTGEVCAAMEGASAAGASEFLVNDSHGPMRNLLLDRLPAGARVIFGNRKPLSMVQGLDRSFAGAFFTGYHGAIGDRDAVLAHTYTPSVVYELRLNGTVCSEATINAALAGWYGVPVLLVTGDASTVAQTQEQMPWVTGVVVKESYGNYSVNSLSPQAARAAIRDGAQRAVRDVERAKPFMLETPFVLEIDVAMVEQADMIELMPSFERVAGRTVRFTSDDFPTVFRAFVAAFRLGAAATERA